MDLIQGSTYILDLDLTENGQPLNIDEIEKVQVILGTIEKSYPENITYEGNKFIISLSQEDTFALQGTIKQQVRVKYKDGQVKSTLPTSAYVYDSITEKVL